MKLEDDGTFKEGMWLSSLVIILTSLIVLSQLNINTGKKEIVQFFRQGEPITIYKETERFSKHFYASGGKGEILNGSFIDDGKNEWYVGRHFLRLNGEDYEK